MNKQTGYSYFVSDEMLQGYEKKSIKLRLEWLYQLNKLRKGCSRKMIKIQDKFRKGVI